jgi:hypothetical protein
MVCKFIKYFKEPTKKYVCMSTVLFFKDKYIKVSRNLKTSNKTEDKVTSFYNNLKETENMLTKKIYPEDFYLRIYYDKSIFKIQKYVTLFEKFKQNKKIQLVEFHCEHFMDNDNFHIDLFGSFMRFYTIFDNESTKMEYCILTDADNIYTEKFVEIFDTFKKSKNLVYTFNKITQIGFHGNDYMENNNFFDYIYLLGGFTIIKKNKIFDIKYWEKYFNNMFQQNDLMYIYNYIDFKRYAFNAILNKVELKPQSYYSFNYGADEVWLNYVIKKILSLNKKENKLDAYIVKDYNIILLLTRLIDIFKYNSIVNIEEFKLFIKNCDFLKQKNYHELANYIHFLKNKRDEKMIIKFFDELKSNYYFNRIYVQNNIKYIICNFQELLDKRGKYNYFDITLTKQ